MTEGIKKKKKSGKRKDDFKIYGVKDDYMDKAVNEGWYNKTDKSDKTSSYDHKGVSVQTGTSSSSKGNTGNLQTGPKKDGKEKATTTASAGNKKK